MAHRGDDAGQWGDPVRAVMRSPQFARVLDELGVRTGRSAADLREDAESALREMAADLDERATMAWDRLGRFLTRAYQVDADSSRLPALSELNR